MVLSFPQGVFLVCLVKGWWSILHIFGVNDSKDALQQPDTTELLEVTLFISSAKQRLQILCSNSSSINQPNWDHYNEWNLIEIWFFSDRIPSAFDLFWNLSFLFVHLWPQQAYNVAGSLQEKSFVSDAWPRVGISAGFLSCWRSDLMNALLFLRSRNIGVDANLQQRKDKRLVKKSVSRLKCNLSFYEIVPPAEWLLRVYEDCL